MGIQTSLDQLVAIAAVHALGKIGDDEASRAVARLLSDDRPFMREHAAWVLGSGMPRSDAVARLIGPARAFRAVG